MGHWDSGNLLPPHRNVRDLPFLKLRDSVFCTECELISRNNSSRCLFCDSAAVLSLSRVLGGSLRGKETARLLHSEELDRLIDRFMDDPELLSPAAVGSVWSTTNSNAEALESTNTPLAPKNAAANWSVERACALTPAAGAAAAIADGGRLFCRARAGALAPDLEAPVPDQGITALCVRTRLMWRSDDTEREPWVNRDACRRLGIRSVVVAPVLLVRRVLGVLEVFSPSPSAFDDSHAATVQFLAGALALAIVRDSAPAVPPANQLGHAPLIAEGCANPLPLSNRAVSTRVHDRVQAG